MTQPLVAPSPKPKKDTARTRILARLTSAGIPLAVHELNIQGHSENAMATELSTMARLGLVQGRYRPGKAFKEWYLPDNKV